MLTSLGGGRRIRRLPPVILGVAFLSTYFIALLGPLLPAVAGPLGGDALAIGLLFSSYSLAQFTTAPVLGALGDRFGRRVVLIGSLGGGITGFSIFTIGVATGAGLWVLFLGWIIVGASDCWIATAYSYVADTTEPGIRTRFFAFLAAGIASAFVIGPTTSGLLSAFGTIAPLFILAGLLVVAIVWAFFAMPESLPAQSRTTTLQLARLNPLAQLRDMLAFPQLRILLAAYLLFWPAVITLSANLPTMLAERADWNTGQVASVLVIYGVLVVSMQMGVVPRLARRFREVGLAIAGASLSAGAFAVLATYVAVGSPMLAYAGVALFGLGQPLVQTGMTAAMSKSMGAQYQGRVQGAVAATMAMAQVIGPVLVGWLYAHAGPAVPYWTISAQIGAAIVLMIVAAHRLGRVAGTAPLAEVAE